MAADITLDGLEEAIPGGAVVYPRTDDCERARQVFNAMIDRRPAAIVRCANAADVRVAVHYSRTLDISLSVRGGGHNVAGTAVCDGGLMVDLSLMKAIDIGPMAEWRTYSRG